MEDEYLTRCIVDPVKKTVRLLSSEGDEKVVDCTTTEEFMNVLEFVRATVDETVPFGGICVIFFI